MLDPLENTRYRVRTQANVDARTQNQDNVLMMNIEGPPIGHVNSQRHKRARHEQLFQFLRSLALLYAPSASEALLFAGFLASSAGGPASPFSTASSSRSIANGLRM